MDILSKSWNSFSEQRAVEYLVTYGHPSSSSKKLLADLIKKDSKGGTVSIIDMGCGNAHLYNYFIERKIKCNYTGVDISEPLLEAAKKRSSDIKIIIDDVNTLDKINGKYDYAVYSHVIEMLSSPEESLLKARDFADKIIIRFFEPPEFEFDRVEIKEMEVGDQKIVPYLRRKMSKDYYRLILSKMKCNKVEIYKDLGSKDQIHILYY